LLTGNLRGKEGKQKSLQTSSKGKDGPVPFKHGKTSKGKGPKRRKKWSFFT